MGKRAENKYDQIIEHVFFKHFKEGDETVTFKREEFGAAARALGIDLPKNLGDVIYSYRFRKPLPKRIRATEMGGRQWTIRLSGHGQYAFCLVERAEIVPSQARAAIKVPDATPGIIAMYALSDEQALLAKLRYNRLLDIFTRVACYSLQNHLRTTAPGVGQIETDEIYVGVDRKGRHYVLPVQAKGAKDKLSVVQVEQDIELCRHRFPDLICRPIGAQFLGDDVIVLFEFIRRSDKVEVVEEKHYQLVPPEEISPEDLAVYNRPDGDDA